MEIIIFKYIYIFIFLLISSNSFSNKELDGVASWYSGYKITASGEKYKTYKDLDKSLTAAHKTLPFNTKVKVTRLDNKKSVIVRINNRGPFIKGRVIDLTKDAAKKLDMIDCGICKVKIEVIK